MNRPGIALTALVLCALGTRADGSYVGKEFPDFKARDVVSGRRFSLREYRGQVVLVDFWATWCQPCVTEIPNVKAVFEKYRNRGLVVISISLDEDTQACRHFVNRHRLKWHQVIEGGGAETRLAKDFNIRSIPATFIIDHQGICVSDAARGAALERTIAQALAKRPSGAESPGAAEPDAEREHERPERRLVPGRSAELSAALEALEEAGVRLDVSAGPLKKLTGRLDAADDLLDSIEVTFPVPDDTAGVARLWRSLYDELSDLRHELFLCGFLDETVVILPADPLAGGGVRIDRSEVRSVRVALTPAREAIARMRTAVDPDDEHVELEAAALGRMARQLGSGVEPGDAREACAEVATLAEALDRRFRDPWKHHLETLDEVIAGLTVENSEYGRQLDDLVARIEQGHDTLRSAGRNTRTMIELRDELTAIFEGLEEACREAVRRGLLAEVPDDLPENPLASGQLRTVRARVTAGEQLDRAGEVVASLRRAAAAGPGRLNGFDGRIATLQADLESAGDDAAALADLEQRTTVLCREILRALDG